MSAPRGRSRQRGGALLIIAALLLLGIGWGAMNALAKVAAPTRAERETRTGAALERAKKALLGYVAQQAALSTNAVPGQMPCPEALTSIDTAAAGDEGTCTNGAVAVGRLPWRTLGIETLYDGYGEPLWYVLGPGFRSAPLNFGSAAQLPFTSGGTASNVVAVIIAPGAPLNTNSVSGTAPSGCSAVNQQVGTRNTAPLSAANFFECGNASGSYVHHGTSDWTNDRVIAITAAEWADAVAPAVGDRLQRQVAPAMMDFRNSTSLASWGERFLPNASTLDASVWNSQPETNDLCGDNDTRSGMPPTITVAAATAAGTCSTTWSGGSLFGLGVLLSFGGCAFSGTDLRCSFTMLLPGIATPGLNLTAPRIGYSFRSFNASDIRIEVNGGAPQAVTVSSYSGTGVSSADGSGGMSFQLQFPWLTVASNVVIVIPSPQDALLADTRSAWWINNGWDRFTYYGVSQAATHDPGFTVCNPGGTVTNCLTVNNLPSPNTANDKRLVLALTGRQLSGTTQPSYTLSNYWEAQNASLGVVYEFGATSSTFNDRVAACPFKYRNHAGTDVDVCT
jgi:hypothetical protein